MIGIVVKDHAQVISIHRWNLEKIGYISVKQPKAQVTIIYILQKV